MTPPPKSVSDTLPFAVNGVCEELTDSDEEVENHVPRLLKLGEVLENVRRDSLYSLST